MSRGRDRTLGRYLGVGLLNTAFGLALIFALKAFAGMGDVAANAGGYGIALFLGFALHRRWTFRHRGGVPATLARYLAVLAVSYFLNLAAVLVAVGVFHVHGNLAQVLGALVYAVVGYAGSRQVAFATPRSAGAAPS